METKRNERRRETHPEQAANAAPQVMYTQPKPFRRGKLLLHLATLFAAVLAIFMGLSVFFKVDTILVAGAEKHTADEVAAASGIEHGDSLFFFGRAGAYSRIRQQLPYVQDVQFRIKLPGTVMIIVQEAPVVYAIQDTDTAWWLMDSNGRITQKADNADVKECTQITGVYLQNPQVGASAVAAEPAPDPDREDPIVVYEADKLKAALMILRELEANQILGKVTTVEVGELAGLKMWYGTRFQVLLGNTEQLDYKIAMVRAAVDQMDPQRTGILDATLEKHEDGIHYRPFED